MQLTQRFGYQLLLVFAIAILGGCFETRIKQTLLSVDPLLISKENANAIKTLIVFPKIDKSVSNEEIIYVTETLENSGRFVIISPNRFTRVAEKEGFVISGMTTSDRVDVSKIIGKKLSADAVLFIKAEEVEVSANPAEAFFTFRGNVSGNNKVTIRDVNSGNIIWEQIQEVNMSVSGFKSTNTLQLIKPQYDPIIANILHSFSY